jgi:hypothetical protein
MIEKRLHPALIVSLALVIKHQEYLFIMKHQSFFVTIAVEFAASTQPL